MKFDSHVHSAASPDSDMNPAEAVSILQKKGLGVIFTEHVDYITPVEKADPSADDCPTLSEDFIYDASLYPQSYEKLRAQGVLLGLEIGLTKAFAGLNEQTAKEYDYDFILGSIHFIDGYDIYTDYFKQQHYEDHYRRMLEYSAEAVKASGLFFDSFGHIDYVSRVSPFVEKNVWYKNYSDEYDALLRLLAERDTALEINTRRLNDRSAQDCWLEICKQFKRLGGKFVTIGSDAHHIPALGQNFTKAERIAEAAGLAVVHFQKRNRIIKYN